MNYLEAVDYIEDTSKYGSNLGLETVGNLLGKLGNPQDGLKYIHIAGTNGKGSTSSYVSYALQEAGYRVGFFSSPYLERFNERIQINGVDIPDDVLARLTDMTKEAIDEMLEEGMNHPTSFEIITAIMFLYFQETQPDYVVLEVGLGGRLDSTNIIKDSIVSVITTLAIDHVEQLGDTLGKIAYQKAGIIKENGLVVSYPQKDEATQVIKEVSDEMNAELYFDTLEDIEVVDENEFGSVFNLEFKGEKLENIEIGLIGQYQVYNASLAITTLLVLREKGLINISDEELLAGIKKTKWKGRLEVLKRNPTFLIDGAHNEQGVDHLKTALELFNYDRLILGIAVLKDKDVDHIVNTMMSIADEVVVTEVEDPRKTPVAELAAKAEKYGKPVYMEKDIEDAVIKAESIANENDMIVFGGSLYLVGTVRTLVNGNKIK